MLTLTVTVNVYANANANANDLQKIYPADFSITWHLQKFDRTRRSGIYSSP